MGTQIGVNAPTRLDANSRTVGYDKKLRMKSLLEDIHTHLTGLYNTEMKSIPNATMMEVGDDINDKTSAVITVKLKLREGGVYGTDFAIGREELVRTRAVTIYRNDLRKVVSTPGYGVRKLDAKLYGLYEQHIEDLADWNKEQEGLEIRQAPLERYGETLVHGDTAAACVRNYNMNILVAGLTLAGGQPTYSNNVVTYTTNIVAKIQESGGGDIKTPTLGQTANSDTLSNASNYCIAKRISPLMIPGLPGGRGYIMTISELQAVYVGDPQWSARNMGSMYLQKAALPEKVMNWPGVIGAYKDFLIAVDPRQPTLDITGTSAPFGLSAGYLWPGDVDERNRDQRTVCDTAFILGKGAYINWCPEKLHHIQQLDDYGKLKGHGTALVRGIQTPHYTDAAGNNPEQFTSAVVLLRFPE
ncbi:MAG TPA: hypothetical protein VMV77_09250 [Bacteroidales bacterium]|nr:hypothetical protein [Bacteroidales bacterium]